jgi:hypothetical protein
MDDLENIDAPRISEFNHSTRRGLQDNFGSFSK